MFDLLVREMGDLPENLSGVAAHDAAAPSYRARGVRHLRDDPGQRDGSQLFIRNLRQHIAGAIVGILENIFHREAPRSRDRSLGQRLLQRAEGSRACPAGDDLVKLVHVARARERADKARVFNQLRLPIAPARRRKVPSFAAVMWM